MSAAAYQPSPINLRHRATKAEVEARRAALLAIVSPEKPMTVRQVYYQAVVTGLVEKTEGGYKKVQRELVLMRRDGTMPFSWIADNTRWMRRPTTHNSIEQALLDTAQFYRKSLWQDANCYVEIWLESDALAGSIFPITSKYDVPLMVARGYSSATFTHSTAAYIAGISVPTFLYHLGDYDPSGVNAAEVIERDLREMAPDAEIHFERLALTPEQIVAWDLPTRPTKTSDTRAKGFGKVSVELDAMAPAVLRTLAEQAIQRHLPRHEFDVLMVSAAMRKRA